MIFFSFLLFSCHIALYKLKSIVIMKKKFVLIFVSATVALGLAAQPCAIGGLCKQDGLPGVYSLDKDCPHFLRLAPEKRYGHGWCNFSEKNAVICCIGASHAIATPRPRVTTTPRLPKNRRPPPKVIPRMGEVCESFGANNFTTAVDRIFGGLESFPGQFPHFAALGYNRTGDISFDCGGTLISDSYVLTAAHCVQKNNPPVFVRLGVVKGFLFPSVGHRSIEIPIPDNAQ